MTNTAIWKSLSVTDPKYTKKVNVGGGFTSINAQWQIQRMTEQFGPVGKGWTYKVAHSIERIADDYVLAVADVTIYWCDDETKNGPACFYGPVRGMAPIIEKSKNGYLMKDDDAGKKAATDALTKGLSHLGLSADVFLGLYDDNKYVREAGKHFAEQASNDAPQEHSWTQEARKDGLMDNAPEQKPEVVERARARVNNAIDAFKMAGHTKQSLMDYWQREKKTFDAIYKHVPSEHERLVAAYNEALESAPSVAA